MLLKLLVKDLIDSNNSDFNLLTTEDQDKRRSWQFQNPRNRLTMLGLKANSFSCFLQSKTSRHFTFKCTLVPLFRRV